MSDRPEIPAAAKRLVRQKCYFGCIICGIPFYQYEHIEPYSKVQEHDPDNIVLLCALCHDQKTRGILSKSYVQSASKNPRNAKLEFSPAHRLRLKSDKSTFKIGGSTFTSDVDRYPNFSALSMYGQNVCGTTVEDGNLLFTLSLADSKGNRFLEIRQNELIVATNVWDYQFEGTHIVIRTAFRQPVIKLQIKDDTVNVNRGYFPTPHYIRVPRMVQVTETTVIFPGDRTVANVQVHNWPVGMDYVGEAEDIVNPNQPLNPKRSLFI